MPGTKGASSFRTCSEKLHTLKLKMEVWHSFSWMGVEGLMPKCPLPDFLGNGPQHPPPPTPPFGLEKNPMPTPLPHPHPFLVRLNPFPWTPGWKTVKISQKCLLLYRSFVCVYWRELSLSQVWHKWQQQSDRKSEMRIEEKEEKVNSERWKEVSNGRMKIKNIITLKSSKLIEDQDIRGSKYCWNEGFVSYRNGNGQWLPKLNLWECDGEK